MIRACRKLGLQTVAIYSEIDADALHVQLADEAVCVGPAPSDLSYLNMTAILAAAEVTGADAVHPGYGFLSEAYAFAHACELCGLTFIGPRPEEMLRWGDKVAARELAKRYGLPLLEGSTTLQDIEHAVREANRIGFPVMLKAAGGGGGRACTHFTPRLSCVRRLIARGKKR